MGEEKLKNKVHSLAATLQFKVSASCLILCCFHSLPAKPLSRVVGLGPSWLTCEKEKEILKERRPQAKSKIYSMASKRLRRERRGGGKGREGLGSIEEVASVAWYDYACDMAKEEGDSLS